MFQGVILRLLRLFRPDYPKKGLSGAEQAQAVAVGSASAWPINGILATAKFAQSDVVPKLPTIHQPTLIMHSQGDAVVGPENSQRLLQLLGSTNKHIQAIPVATHRPFRDEQATIFMAQHTQQFIQAVIAHS